MDLKNSCIELRKNGKSFREIAKFTNTSLSTVFLWTKNVQLSKIQIKKLKEVSLNKLQESRKVAQKIKRDKYQTSNFKNREIGKNIFGKISENNINQIIAALYWGEGFKKDNRLGLANTDPKIIKLFIYWLVKYMKVPKVNLRVSVGINIGFANKVGQIESFWSKATNIPQTQFNKPFFQKTKLTRIYPNNNEYFGVARIRAIGQNDVFRKLLGMIDGLKCSVDSLDID